MTAPYSVPVESIPAEPTRSDAAPIRGTVLLSGRLLTVARVGWLVIAIGAVGLFLASLPYHYAWLAEFNDPNLNDPEAVRAGVERLGIPPGAFAGALVFLAFLFAAIYVTVAVVIFIRRSSEAIALFVSLTLLTFGTSFTLTLEALVGAHPALRDAADAVDLLGWTSFFLLFYLFPDGRFVPRWTRWLAIVWVGTHVIALYAPGTPISPDRWPSPLADVYLYVSQASMLFAQVYRYRRISDSVQRQQTKWVAFALVIAIASIVGGNIVLAAVPAVREPGIPAALFVLGWSVTYVGVFAVFPVAVAFSILRYRLWDIDLVINRALVYVSLTACVVGLYALLVGGLGALLQAEGSLAISLPAAALIAVLCQPMRERLQRGINRLLYGERDDPYAVLSRLGQRLEGTLAPDAVLPPIVQTVREALRVPYAAIELPRDPEPATRVSTGNPANELLRLPLVYHQETVGELVVAARAPGEAFGPADRRLLNDLARQAGGAVHSVRMYEDLQRSRERLVATREEERRRLRRDLHDGLGPMLGSLTLKLDAVRRLMRQDPDAADVLLAGMKEQTQHAIADIRRLVHALRPPALDELGLAGALQELAAQYDSLPQDDQGLTVAIEAPDRMPHLPAAVEVAAYHLAQEALTNVARHANARYCRIKLSLDDGATSLRLEIADDGRGLPADRRAGVGLGSMRERATELGGTWAIEPGRPRGTVVTACLPITTESTHGTVAIANDG